jgi:hypothetical protein
MLGRRLGLDASSIYVYIYSYQGAQTTGIGGDLDRVFGGLIVLALLFYLYFFRSLFSLSLNRFFPRMF